MGTSPAAADDFARPPSAPTANTLSERAVFVEPHSGHFAVGSPLIVRTSCSNLLLHDWQVYS